MDMKAIGSIYYENFVSVVNKAKRERALKDVAEANVCPLFASQIPGMVPYKRPAADKSGIPVYQPSANNYQQLMHMQQPFVPVSCEPFLKC